MPRFSFPRSLRWTLLAGAAGWLLAAGAVVGCAGSLDPSLNQTGSGGTTGTGTGGSTGSGGGGSTVDCTGSNAGDQVITSTCAAVCHGPGTAPLLGGGLDLTVNSTIASRLVGVKTMGTSANMSQCIGNTTPYLNANSNPATGLLIDKINPSPMCTQNRPECCGDQMPSGGMLTATQFACVRQWATTLSSP